MTNWKEQRVPFENFTEELTYEWMKNGFDKNQSKEWLNAGMKTEDSGFCAWLRDEIQTEPQEVLSNYQTKDLREQYKEYSEENKLNEQIINKIKELEEEFKKTNKKRERTDYWYEDKLNQEQKSLIERLIPNIKLRERYRQYGLCKSCNQPCISYNWCQICNPEHFRQNFDKWTSSNYKINEFIQKYQLSATNYSQILEWIPYERFTDVKYLAEGGFGKVYKAGWVDGIIIDYDVKNEEWWRYKDRRVVLKILNDSRSMEIDFLQEITYHKLFESDKGDNNRIVRCYGISQNPQTGNYAMVMEYINHGNLREYLNNYHNILGFRAKTSQFLYIAEGLKHVHNKGLVHRDFHSGNVLSGDTRCYITDLGLSRPANETDKGKNFGVLPYMAPEVLCGKKYTPAADIYSFGIMSYEILSGSSPYHDLAHEEFLAVKICQGLRPKFNIRIPRLLEDLIEKCWDANPEKRLCADELYRSLKIFHDKYYSEFYLQCKEIEEFNKTLSKTIKNSVYQTHPQAIYTSRLLGYKNLPEPRNSTETNEVFYKLTEELEDLRISDPVKFSKELEKRFKNLEIKEIGDLTTRTKRQLSLLAQTQRDSKSIKLDEKLASEPMEIDNFDWNNLPNFTLEQIQQWINYRFTSSQIQDWLNIGLQPTEANFAAYLRDTKHLTPEEVLNQANYSQLREEYRVYQEQLQFQQEQPPKKSL